jgi:hypothetical protein
MVAEFDNAIKEIIDRIPDEDTKSFMEKEFASDFELMRKVYETADITHLPEEIKSEIEPRFASQISGLQKEKELTLLPDPSMHNPQEVDHFVESYLAERGETPRNINLQIIGVKTLQNPELIDRFLNDFDKSKKSSEYKGEVVLFIIDDSWDDTAAEQIAKVAKDHGVDYYRVREDKGFADKFTKRFADKLRNSPETTELQQKYLFGFREVCSKTECKLRLPMI